MDPIIAPQPPQGDPYAKIRTAALVILATLAGACILYFGHELFVPIAFAILLAAVFRPLVRRLHRFHIPPAITAAVVGIALVAAIVAAGYALASPLKKGLNNLPHQFEAAQQKLERFRRPVQQVADAADRVVKVTRGTAPSSEPGPATTRATTEPAAPGATSKPSGPPPAAVEPQPPQAPEPPAEGPSVLGRVFGTTSRLLSAVTETLILLVLILGTGDLLSGKIVKVMPTPGARNAAEKILTESEAVVLRYLVVTLLINTSQGIIIGLVLWWLGMPEPWLWAILTVILEFIPYLGATVMVALLGITAMAAFDSLGRVLAVPGAYLFVTTVQNNVVSPIAYGNRLKLNPVTVLVSVLLWWFIWGTPGAFLAVPIVATIKVIADHTPRLSALAELLGE